MAFDFSDETRSVVVHNIDRDNVYISSQEVVIQAGEGLPGQTTTTDLLIFDPEKEVLQLQTDNTWKVIENNIGKTVYNKENCLDSMELTALGAVPEGWTEKEPITQWDEWLEADDNWVTNLSNKYIAEYAEVDAIRESLYRAQTDPLENKAARLARNGATAEELQVYYDRIDELVAKIKTDNPWPTQPIS